ncbi:hypothetical protein MRS44_013831 [Fusarium solani]|uniref:uncharacterized protein n=1 Tax=Fusarium solani TaxID=169388 RepID=UPI0032C49436|nr:hypothetical protein MRS44_013831 [Fusarium solani]
MNSQSILEESQAFNAYDDKSFIKEDHSHQLHPNDPTRIAVFPAETDRGTNFEPFHILHRHLRPFDHTKIDETGPLPKVFQACDEWSDHIQAASAEIFFPGSHLAVDECMIRYTGRSNETTVVKGKPIPLGFKIWVIAQQGFFIHWLWHIKGEKYGAVGVELPKPASSSRGRGKRASQAPKKEPKEEDKPIALNSTQGVVVALANTLPKATYHVFVDNLFSSADLFRSLRTHGHGATGTARPNCGIHKELQRDKKADGGAKTSYDFNQVKIIPTPDNKVNQIAWKDNRLILFLTTVFTGEERVCRKRKKPSSQKPEAKPIRRFFGDEAVKVISIPTVAAAYNDEMNHVDRGDQLSFTGHSQIGRDIRITESGESAFSTPYLMNIMEKASQGRGIELATNLTLKYSKKNIILSAGRQIQIASLVKDIGKAK